MMGPTAQPFPSSSLSRAVVVPRGPRPRRPAVRGGKGSETLIVQCAWCLAVKVGGVYRTHNVKIYEASHGICPTCAKTVRDRWEVTR